MYELAYVATLYFYFSLLNHMLVCVCDLYLFVNACVYMYLFNHVYLCVRFL